MAARGRPQILIALSGGMVAGIFGGILLTLYSLLTAFATDRDPWVAFKGASVIFFGERAFTAGFDMTAVVVGILVHFAVSIGWGAIFGLIAFGASVGGTLLIGASYGAIVWVVMYFVVLPAVGLGALARSTPAVPALLMHVVFGLAVGFGFLPFQHRQRGGAS
jgi:hypothetical protein